MPAWYALRHLPTLKSVNAKRASSTGVMKTSHSGLLCTRVRYIVRHSTGPRPPIASSNAAAPPITKMLSTVELWGGLDNRVTAASSEGEIRTSSGMPSATLTSTDRDKTMLTRPRRGRNLAGILAQVLRPIITAFVLPGAVVHVVSSLNSACKTGDNIHIVTKYAAFFNGRTGLWFDVRNWYTYYY